MASKDVRVGLVGAGYIADWHAQAVTATSGARLTAVCDRTSAAAQALAERHGVAHYDSLKAMIDSGRVDAVHILTPPDSHRALAEQALRGGLHCLVEKPMAPSLADCEAMVATADKVGRRLAIGHNFLGLPGYTRLKAARDAGRLGRITSAEINWHLPLSPLRSGPYGLWLLASPRNLLLELGPHPFAFAHDLFGPLEIEHLSLGKPITLPDGTRRPQSWRILARAGAVDVTITLSLVETVDDRSVVLRGSSALARLDYAADTLVVQAENASDIVINPARRQISLAGQALGEGTVNAARQIGSLYRKSPYGISFLGMCGAFYDAIRAGRAPDARFDASAGVEVMRAITDTAALLPRFTPARRPAKPEPKPDVLVIGGTGFIGRALVDALVARGRDVRVQSRGGGDAFAHMADRVQTVSCALSDEDGLGQAMEGMRHVYHLGKSLDATWEAALKNDVGVTETIARAALTAGVEHFVYTGTIASYDMSDPERVITETTGFEPDMSDRNIYARSKALCEARLLAMHREQGLPLTIARPGIVLGKGGPMQHWGIGRWHGAGAVRIWGHGRNPLPFVLIDDVAEALAKVVETEAAIGDSVNLVGPPMLSARDYFDAIHRLLGARITVRPGALRGLYLAGEAKYLLKRYGLRRKGLARASLNDWRSRAHFSQFDNAHARKLLDWHPEDDADAFLRRAVTEANLFGF